MRSLISGMMWRLLSGVSGGGRSKDVAEMALENRCKRRFRLDSRCECSPFGKTPPLGSSTRWVMCCCSRGSSVVSAVYPSPRAQISQTPRREFSDDHNNPLRLRALLQPWLLMRQPIGDIGKTTWSQRRSETEAWKDESGRRASRSRVLSASITLIHKGPDWGIIWPTRLSGIQEYHSCILYETELPALLSYLLNNAIV